MDESNDSKKKKGGRPKGLPKTGGKPAGYKFPVTLEKDAAKEELRKQLTAQMIPITEALLSRCKGVRYFVSRNKTGKFEIVTDPQKVIDALNKENDMQGEFYTEKPDTAAIKEALDRMVGQSEKPKEQTEHSGQLVIKHEI